MNINLHKNNYLINLYMDECRKVDNGEAMAGLNEVVEVWKIR